jgi:hypothetical protein
MKMSAACSAALAIALCALPARAGLPADFDKGVDAKAAVEVIKAAAAEAPTAAASSRPVALRTERDCVTVSFNAQDPLSSERIYLMSREYREVCSHGPNGQTWCREELAWTHRATARVRISDRGEMLPWEKDVFWMCLDGSWLSADVIDASHKYALKWQIGAEAVLTAEAGEKSASYPDPNGIAAAAPRYDTGSKSLAWDLSDRWSSYYGEGEATVLSFQLKRSRENWFDALVLEKEVSLPPAPSATVRFADYAAEFQEKLKDGAKYYVNWRFKRAGKVSRDAWMKYRETDLGTFAPSAAPAAKSRDLAPAALKVCWFKAIEEDECVYKCSDKTEHRQSAAIPDPAQPDQPVLACPQLVFPF